MCTKRFIKSFFPKIFVSFLISIFLSFVSLLFFPSKDINVYAQSNCYCKKIYCDNTRLPEDRDKCNAPPGTVPPCRCEYGLYIVVCPENSFFEDCVRQVGCGGGEYSCDISDCDTPYPCNRQYANCYFG
ncbi:MAG: hypothetical protein N2169_08065, partial [bacterium]|nr:hypothetical protein [bacterium]